MSQFLPCSVAFRFLLELGKMLSQLDEIPQPLTMHKDDTTSDGIDFDAIFSGELGEFRITTVARELCRSPLQRGTSRASIESQRTIKCSGKSTLVTLVEN